MGSMFTNGEMIFNSRFYTGEISLTFWEIIGNVLGNSDRLMHGPKDGLFPGTTFIPSQEAGLCISDLSPGGNLDAKLSSNLPTGANCTPDPQYCFS